MDTTLYDKLIQLAKDGDLAAYSDVAPLIGLDMSKDQDRDIIAKKLGHIADHEDAAGRPMLTALIVHYGNDNNPGEGFFAKAVELGHYKGSRDPLRRLTFWANQVRDIYDHWQTA
ncbi:hypothetical protein [Xanthomonas bonasiae]|uniref:hypothetical protein n=1 Tax=Xanthomonas bonasiae TaxID=2810351 RepID=UPI001781A865|nr:hypothetical protein [Xanthomonas surreyensis]MBD7923175.1 hypothetical protein [Xanthomonas surreyensis]